MRRTQILKAHEHRVSNQQITPHERRPRHRILRIRHKNPRQQLVQLRHEARLEDIERCALVHRATEDAPLRQLVERSVHRGPVVLHNDDDGVREPRRGAQQRRVRDVQPVVHAHRVPDLPRDADVLQGVVQAADETRERQVGLSRARADLHAEGDRAVGVHDDDVLDGRVERGQLEVLGQRAVVLQLDPAVCEVPAYLRCVALGLPCERVMEGWDVLIGFDVASLHDFVVHLREHWACR